MPTPNNPQPGDYILLRPRLTFGQPATVRSDHGRQPGVMDFAQSQVSDIAGGRQAVQDALYAQYTANSDQRYGRDEEALRTRPERRPGPGTARLRSNRLPQFRQNGTRPTPMHNSRAITGADAQQNNAVARLANILAMSGPSMPTSANSWRQSDGPAHCGEPDLQRAALVASNASKAYRTRKHQFAHCPARGDKRRLKSWPVRNKTRWRQPSAGRPARYEALLRRRAVMRRCCRTPSGPQ